MFDKDQKEFSIYGTAEYIPISKKIIIVDVGTLPTLLCVGTLEAVKE